jgi:4-hydroxymandelate oxidase
LQRLSKAQITAIRTLEDFESLAMQYMSPAVYEYVAGGAGADQTVIRNRTAFNKISILPRVLEDVSSINTQVSLFGRWHPFPILLAPAGYHKLIHAVGEMATVEGANDSGAVLVAAAFSTVTYEHMRSRSRQGMWFQLYVQKDRSFTRDLVERVLAAGCDAICVTVDVPVNGPRDRELRAGFNLPIGMERANLAALGLEIAAGSHRPNGRQIYSATHAADVTWDDIDWLRSFIPKPLLIKGIMHPDDAAIAYNTGCDGVMLSNHGGRSLDTMISTIEALPRMVDRLQDRIPVILDGGVRRGVDVFKALAMGAKAVMIGRPYLYGLAVGGSDGVCRVVEILRTELEMTMGLAGCRNLAEITKDRLDNI